MEYLDGGSLQSLAAGGVSSEPVPEHVACCALFPTHTDLAHTRRLQVLEHVAYCALKGLAHMHDMGMVHRDIKVTGSRAVPTARIPTALHAPAPHA
jgi:serine/threonine protein kinase